MVLHTMIVIGCSLGLCLGCGDGGGGFPGRDYADTDDDATDEATDNVKIIYVEVPAETEAENADTDGSDSDDTDSAEAQDGGGTDDVSQPGGDGFSMTEGYMTAGVWSGYAWTSTDKNSTISPANYTTTTEDGPMCVSGTVGASWSSVALVGFNIAQEEGSKTTKTYQPTGGELYLDVTNDGGSPLRIQIQAPGGATDLDLTWCTEIAADGPQTVAWDSLVTRCGEPGKGTAYTGQGISAVMVLVPGNPDGSTPFDFCFNNVAPVD